MNKKRLLEVAVTLCTVGSAVFAVGVSESVLSQYVTLPRVAFGGFTASGAALVVVGAALFVAAFVMDRLREAVTEVVYGDVDARYVCTSASSGELPGIFDLYTRYFGADVPRLELMRAWLDKCPSAFTLVHRLVTNESGLAMGRELVGSFKVLPLSLAGVRAIELGQATGSTFRAEHLCGARRRPAGVYVGDVVATTPFARGIVIAQLTAAIEPTAKGELTVYARPLTRDGLRIMIKHGFLQASDGRSAPQLGLACKLTIGTTKPATNSGSGSRLRRRLLPVGKRLATVSATLSKGAA
jgi:hypothetical protein